jgi:phosphoserine phosphatase RsbU/P
VKDQSAVETVIRRLLELAHAIEPEQVPHLVAEQAEGAGFLDVEIYLVDHRQVQLCSTMTKSSHSVDGTLAGDTYRRKRAHVVEQDAGDYRVWVPLIDGEDRLGVLSTTVSDDSDEVIDDVHVLAACAAGLIVSKRAYTDGYESARRLEHMDLAAEFRWTLLPPLTCWTPRVRVAGMLEPAYEIAGDAFDYALNGDTLHVAMFDAVGHGMGACRLANLAVAMYRNARRSGADLTETAVAIGDILIQEFGNSWFVTALLGELNVDRGTFRFMTAGHPLPLLLRSGKVVATLTSRPGMPLGLGGPPPEVSEAQLEPEDSIFCYSDGVTEARNDANQFFGEDGVADYLARAAADDLWPAETVRRLVMRLYDHRPAPLHDDATMLLINWCRSTDDAPAV